MWINVQPPPGHTFTVPMWRSTWPAPPAVFQVTFTWPFQPVGGAHGAGGPETGELGGNSAIAYSVVQSNAPPGASGGMSKLRGFGPSGRNTPNACGTKNPTPPPLGL